MSCSCIGAGSQKFFQSIEFRFDTVRNQKFSKWTSACFIMDFLAVGDTCLFVLLSGMGSTFYGIAKISIRRLQKFRRVNESLDITCRNEDDVKVRIQGSFCWKIYNEEFEGPTPIISSSQRSEAQVCEHDRLGPTKMNPTLKQLRAYYENFLFTVKNHELKTMEESYESSGGEVNVESGGECSGQSSSNYMRPGNKKILNDSRTAMTMQLGISRKSFTDDDRVKRTRQFIKLIDLSSKITVPDELVRLLCPFCTKPVLCLNSSLSREVRKVATDKPLASTDSSCSNFELLDQ